MKYTLQEGSFSLFPAAWQDNSMNIIRDDESGLSVVVSRGVIPMAATTNKSFTASGMCCVLRWVKLPRANSGTKPGLTEKLRAGS
jgi:hypothetical protein